MCKSARRVALAGLALALCLALLPLPASARKGHEHHRQEAGSRHHERHRQEARSEHRGDGAHAPHRSVAWQRAQAWQHACNRWCELLDAHADDPRARPEVVAFLSLLFHCEVTPPSTEPPEPQGPPPLASLVDEAGTRFADLGVVDADDAGIDVPASSSFVDPVVILGPPTRHEADPGVVQLDAVQADRFRVRFREWTYLDGAHGPEAVSYLILEPGRYRLADGSEWEVGSMDVAEAGAFFSQAFTAPFTAPPALFLTLQTPSADAPVLVRARGVTADGFQAAVMEEEAADGVHGPERIGYLAVSSPPGSGELASASGTLPYLVGDVVAGQLPVPALSSTLWMEEETSADPEVDHDDETLSLLAIGSQLFAQATTYVGPDPATVRRTAPEQAPAMEWGTVDVDIRWHTVPLARSYTDPIIVAGPISRNGGDPGVLRVRNVRGDAFELSYQEWPYLLDGTHLPERAFYLVAERGVQALGGLTVEAGSVDSSTLLSAGMDDVPFTFPFADVPAVFASVNTENDPETVAVRISDRTPAGFRMAMQGQEAFSGSHGAERLGWIAIQRGEGTTSDGRTVRSFDTSVNMISGVSFGGGLRGRFPTVLAHIVSVFGADPVDLRFQNLGADNVELVEQEEQSADSETGHIAEDVSVFVAE